MVEFSKIRENNQLLRIDTGGKRALFWVQILDLLCIIHQMKENICLYLLMYLILKIDMEVENGILKSIFFTFIFDRPYISTNVILGGPKLWMHVLNIHVEGMVSQILF